MRRGLRHFVSCVFIFVLAAGAYQWHRYEIFDMRHHQTTASGKGMQILYSEYLYLGDFGYRLSPDIGPNTKLLLTKIQEALQPSVQELALVKANIGQSTPFSYCMCTHIHLRTVRENLHTTKRRVLLGLLDGRL